MTPSTLWSTWSWEPTVVVPLTVTAAIYSYGVIRLWLHAGVGKGVRVWQAICVVAGVLSLVVALVSPLDALADDLVWVHMVQHLLLLLVAAPLFALGQPLTALLWAAPRSLRSSTGKWWRDSVLQPAWVVLSLPLVSLTLNTIVTWVWHWPGLYDAAVENNTIHAVEHICFLAAGFLFWWTVVHAGKHGRRGYGMGVLVLFVSGIQMTLLGALFTFAQSPWYPLYIGRTATWGFTPLQDQQLAGLIMWIPSSMIYLAATCILFVLWLNAIEKHVGMKERAIQSLSVPQPADATLSQGR